MSDAVGASGASSRQVRRPGPQAADTTSTGHRSTGTLLDTLRVAVVMLDTTGQVILWSPPAQELLGWTGDQVVGRRIGLFLDADADLDIDVDIDIDLAADLEADFAGTLDEEAEALGGDRAVRTPVAPMNRVAERILGHLLHQGRWEGILPLRHRDGHIVQVEVRASLLVDGDGKPFVLANLVETGALRSVEHGLAILDSLFDSSPFGVAVLDTDLKFVKVNETLARMHGVPTEDHLGRTIVEALGESDLADPEAQPELAEMLELQRNVLETGNPVVDMTKMGPGGGSYLSVSFSRLEDAAGRVLGVSISAMDVTARHESATKVEISRRRLALLNDVGRRISDLLDVERIAHEMAEALVPAFSDYSGVALLQEVVEGGELPLTPHPPYSPVIMPGFAANTQGPAVDIVMDPLKPIDFGEGSVFQRVLRTGVPELLASDDLPESTFPGDPRVTAATGLGIHSVIVMPLLARGVVLGLLLCARGEGRDPFDADDLALFSELADRAAGALDNARLYIREREGALMLQRSLLPQRVPKSPGVDVAFRYVPGSSGVEVGGDWFDVIPLVGGRVAFVVGDVMGHGLRAAATMGRLRTAIRTLAQLDLPPDKLLQHVNSLADDLAHGPDEPLMATCIYAIYDPGTRRCSIAKAGHLPPLVIDPYTFADSERSTEGKSVGGAAGIPGGRHIVARQLDLPSGAPLGVDGVAFDAVEFEVPDGTVLVLYTDGLIEMRGQDIDEGIDRLAKRLSRRHASLEEACDHALHGLEPGHEPDDIAVLMARLGGLPAGTVATWTFPANPTVVARARRLVRETLAEWNLESLESPAALLVSELVTNSLRYARGPIGVRMVRGASLLVEVSDPSPAPPQERQVTETDEGGRGLQLVARTARRWGTRRGEDGKVVWFELALPGT